MLSNAYFLAKFRFDTAENEPAKNLQNFRKMHFRKMHFRKITSAPRSSATRGRAQASGPCTMSVQLKPMALAAQASGLASSVSISANFRSFSAVSAPIFARKYAFCSIFQNLPDFHTEIFEIWQNSANFATFAKLLLNFHEICKKLLNFPTDFLRKF